MSIVINDTSPRVHYTASAGQTVFEVPFEFLDINDVFVYVGEVLQTYNSTPQFETEYNLIGVGTNDVKQVIFGGGGRLVGELVVIYRDMPIKSPADFPTDGVFPVDELNEAMDSLTAMIQQTEVNVLLRSLTMNWADEPSALNPLPNQAARANKVLGFDDEGQPVAVDPATTGGGGGGTSDDALLLNGQPGSYYLDRTNHTGQEEIADVIGLQDALNLKAPLQSPILTGEPQAPTPPFGDNDTSIATTAFVQMTMSAKLEDAPADAISYGRKNAAWVEVTPEAPADDLIYGRANKGWIAIAAPGGGSGGGSSIIIDPLPPSVTVLNGTMWWDSDQGGLYIYYNDGDSSQWVQVSQPLPTDTTVFVKKTGDTMTGQLTIGGAYPASLIKFTDTVSGLSFAQPNLFFGATTGSWIWRDRADGSGNATMTLAWNGNLQTVASGVTVGGPTLTLQNSSTTPAVGALGELRFGGKNSAAGDVAYGQIFTSLATPTAGAENASMSFNIRVDGSSASRLGMNAAGVQAHGLFTANEDIQTNGGTVKSTTSLILAANVNTISLRPNGSLTTTGQVIVGTSGGLGVGTFTGQNSAGIDVTPSGRISSGCTTAAAFDHHQFWNTNTPYVGYIRTTGTATVFGTSSDANLKTVKGGFDPAEAIAIIRADPVQAFTWKSDGSEAIGWIAQRSHAVHPDLAIPPLPPEEGKEAVAFGEDGYQPWGIDYGRRTPYLWAALTAALDKIDQLEARLAAVEASNGV